MCQAIQLSGTNTSGKPIRMEAARSKISDESAEVDCRFVARASVLELNTLNHQFLHGKDL